MDISFFTHKFFALLAFIFLNLACGNMRGEQKPLDSEVIGQLAEDLDARRACTRTQECPIGNLVTDALTFFAISRDFDVDGAFTNGGGIRGDKIYQAGDWTNATSEEIFPFGNQLVIVSVTGAQLKSIFERSVAGLPEAQGQFLQVSKEIKITVSLDNPAQAVNLEQNEVLAEGQRINSIEIRGEPYDPEANYNFVTNDYIAPRDISVQNDGFVDLLFLDSNHKKFLDVLLIEALQYYLPIFTPVAPQVEGRITINGE